MIIMEETYEERCFNAEREVQRLRAQLAEAQKLAKERCACGQIRIARGIYQSGESDEY